MHIFILYLSLMLLGAYNLAGNDFSKVYAPLIRDGRMDKFYWEPTDDELVDILFQMYKDDGLTKSDMLKLIKMFPGQRMSH